MERTKLTILYDERCAFCRRCRDWLAAQPVLVETELLGAGTREARRRYPDLTVGGKELVVVDEQGQVWIGPAAFEMCLWATARYRSLAYQLSHRGRAKVGDVFFELVSKQRGRLSKVFDDPECEACDNLDLRSDAS